MKNILKRIIRRHELRSMIPLADSTIYEMEKRGEFPKRFSLTSRCVAWDLDEVEEWIQARKAAGIAIDPTAPDVRQRKTRPVRAEAV